jgi:hypothetical protein
MMPQTTMLPVFTADYPILAKAQKPGGVTVLSAVGPGDVPNKPTYVAGTIQIATEATEEAESVEGANPVEEAEPEQVEEEHPSHTGKKPRHRR